MAGSAAAKKTDPTIERRKLAQELATLERKNAVDDARRTEIRAELRKIATSAGESFQEVFAGVGLVKVSPGHDGKFKGTFPVVQEKAYFDLPDAKRKKFEEDGIIKMTPTYGGPYAGSVSVELF